jgi:hypothetical protein
VYSGTEAGHDPAKKWKEKIMKKTERKESTEMGREHLDRVDEARRLWDLIFNPDPELRRKGWLNTCKDIIPPNLETKWLTDPHWFDDFIEAQVKISEPETCPDYFCVQLGDYWCDAENVFELEFLTFLSVALKRGTPFEPAWSRALGIIGDINKVPYIVYELKPEDESEISLWIERICHHGVAPETAMEMAREITALLQQIFLTRDDSFYTLELLEEIDLQERDLLLERLSAPAQVRMNS